MPNGTLGRKGGVSTPEASYSFSTLLDQLAIMPDTACSHPRTRLIARDKDAEYVECLDCGAILDASELEKQEKKEGAGFDESLSDA